MAIEVIGGHAAGTAVRTVAPVECDEFLTEACA
jgi:hypothetical protein